MATVFHLTKKNARGVLTALAQTGTPPVLVSGTQGAATGADDPNETPNEPVIIIVD